MTKENQKNVALETEQIAQTQLLTELRLMMQDIFIGDIREENEEITVRFVNGQKFRIAVLTA